MAIFLDFPDFDPLLAKQEMKTEVAINAMKRDLRNILDSYVGWYDPFAELIQNALDSVEEKAATSDSSYVPEVRVLINLAANSVTVTDNGMGLSQEKYSQFLAPSFSFKTGKTRGHKGVGATFLAYGSNRIQICTKTEDFEAVGKMLNARAWLDDINPPSNPKVKNDKDGPADKTFTGFKSGVSITLHFDKTTSPSDLSWLKATTADQWFKILSIKTGLGAFFENKKVHITIEVTSKNGTKTTRQSEGISYLWPHRLVTKAQPLRVVSAKEDDLFTKQGKGFKMPSSMTNLDAIYETIEAAELGTLITLEDHERLVLERHKPTVYFCYMYSAKVWGQLSNALNIRPTSTVFSGGIQIAANNMPQGEIILIPLNRNTGRQHQVQFVMHFDNCSADLGRKGFQKDIVDFAKDIARKIVEKPIQKVRYMLKPVTGARGDLERETALDEWKDAMSRHEHDHPLELISENFFLPTKRVSITSVPTREQDVIALFNQLLAGGVIRGVRVMSTNERFTYDSMYRVVMEEPTEFHIYDATTNPLGIFGDAITAKLPFHSKPKILEYKFNLDALIEDCEAGEKNSNDIGLVVVWESGKDYESNYLITSLLDANNIDQREYHGVTHIVTNLTNNQREMDLIVLSELIEYLNNPVECMKHQIDKYEQ